MKSIANIAVTLAGDLGGTSDQWVEVLKALAFEPAEAGGEDVEETARRWWKEERDGTGPVLLHNFTPIEVFRALVNFKRSRIMVAALYRAVGE